MTYANFAVIPHYVDGFGRYGEGLITVNGRPDGEGEYIWPACNTKQGFEWFATATLAKRGKGATDLRPYTLLSAWASVVPGVRTTDFTPEEGGHPIYGADNLPDPWSNPQIQRVQAAFNPVAAVDLPYWSASGASDSNGTFPLPQAVPSYARNATVTRNITVFNDDFADTSVGFTWTARLDSADRRGRRVRQHDPDRPARLAGHPAGLLHHPGHRQPRVPGSCRPRSPAATTFTDAVEYFNLSGRRRDRTRTGHLPHRQPQQRQAPRHRRQLHRRRRQGRPAERHPHLDRSAPTQDGLHPALHRLRKGARRQRRQQHGRDCNCSSGRPTAAPTRVVPAPNRRRLLHHRQPQQRTAWPTSTARSTTDGAQVVQWTANGGTNQQWQFVP